MVATLLATLALKGGASYPMTLHKLEWPADPEGFFHGTAFNYLAPKGWKPMAIAGWNLVDTKNVNLLAGAQSPGDRFSYVFCPGLWNTFSGSTGGDASIGGHVQGNKIGVEPPSRLSDYALGLLHVDKFDGFHVDRREDHPRPPVRQNGGTELGETSGVQFSFTLRGQPMEGVLSGRMDVTVYGNPSAPMSTYYGSWGISSLFGVTYPKGQRDKGMRFFSLAAPTYTPTRAFLHAVALHDLALKQMYAQVTQQAIDRARLERELDKKKEEAIMGRYRADQKAKDKQMSAFCDYIGDVAHHVGPDGNDLQSNSNAGDPWVDSHGNVAFGDGPNFDPNQGTGGSWTKLKKVGE